MNLPWREIARALPTSAIALAVDVSVLHALVTLLHWHYLAAACAGFTAGTLVAYGLSIRWVFSHRRLRSPGAEFTLFALVGLAGLVINAAAIATVVEGVGASYLHGKAAAAVITFGFNFLIRRTLLFAPATGMLRETRP